jgi:hypothetical protein
MTDEHLKDSLKQALAQCSLDLQNMADEMQAQTSH